MFSDKWVRVFKTFLQTGAATFTVDGAVQSVSIPARWQPLLPFVAAVFSYVQNTVKERKERREHV